MSPSTFSDRFFAAFSFAAKALVIRPLVIVLAVALVAEHAQECQPVTAHQL